MGTLKTARCAAALGACAAWLASAPALRAQAVSPDSARVQLDSLLVTVTRTAVTASRAPVAITTVGKVDIQDARLTVGLDEALAGVPGLIVANRYNFSLGNRIIVRGLGARAAFGVRGLRVLADGIPLTMPDGQTNLNNVDLGSAGRIDVLRGPASALFGNAAGGVIAIETETAPAEFSTEARVTVGDQARDELTRLAKAQVKLGQTIGGFDYIASVSHLDVEGYRAHARSRQTMVNTRAGFALTDATRLSLVLSAVDVPVAQNPGSLPIDSATAKPTMAWPNNVRTLSGEETRQGQIGARITHERGSARADVALYGIRRTLDNPLPFAYIELERNAGGVRALYDRAFRAAPLLPSLTLGVDVEAQWDDRREFANQNGAPSGAARRDQEDHVVGIGPFAQLRGQTGPFAITVGTRYDAVRFRTTDRRAAENQSGERTLHALSPSAGVTWALGNTTVFGNVGSAFQSPTTTELINTPPSPGEPCCPAGFNPELEPQRATSFELGVRGRAGRIVRYEAVAYHMRLRDALVPFQVPDVAGREFFRNAGRTRHQGIELSTAVLPHPGVLASAAYTYTDVRFRDDGTPINAFRDNRMPGIPPHRFFGALTWQPRAVRITAEVDHNGAYFVNDANNAENPAATIVSVRGSTRLAVGALEIAPFIAINNVFDERYFSSVVINAAQARYYEPAPTRNFYLGATLLTGGWRGR